ncbi:MAG: class I SAM-dependent methyltransferase [Gaiellaceae bacterium]
MTAADRCPVCAGIEIEDTVERRRLPAMQNYVHRTREAALEATAGHLTLALCHRCGFAWNRTFDPTLLAYDDGYDNAVPSAVMERYYREIADHLRTTYELDGGLVVDVGCGNGAFLRMLCEAVPDLRGLGVDPALDREREELGGRVRLVKDVFGAAVVAERPSLVVTRHVLEHMPDPVGFLRAIDEAVAPHGSCPCFFEIPELTSIVRNEAFWDFCYEHCNYFTAASVREALRRAGFGEIATTPAYGGQYLWVEASAGADSAPSSAGPDREAIAMLPAYAAAEEAALASATALLRDFGTESREIAVWGMATKGVLFSVLTDPDASLIDFCVDANTNKQGSFVPLTGHAISAPGALRSRLDDRPLVVVVMNELYGAEIEAMCHALGVTATFVNASGQSTGGVSRIRSRSGTGSPGR